MKNRDQVSSLIIAQPRNQLMLFLNDLIRSFSEENSLEPLRFLGEFIGMTKKDLLVSNNLSHKIKENSSIISIISATIFASLTFLIQLGDHAYSKWIIIMGNDIITYNENSS